MSGERLCDAPAAAPSTREAAWLWAGLLVAFSPALAELAVHWRAEPWARCSLALLWMLPLCAASAERRPGRRDGLLLVGAGLALEVFAAAAGPAKLGRPGLVLGVIGMARSLGHPPLRVAALAAFLVPVPAALARLPDPLLRPPLLEAAAAAGSSLEAVRLGIAHGDSLLRIYPHDLGVPLAFLFAGAAWAASTLRRDPLLPALARSAAAALLALPLQLVLLAAAALVLEARGPEAARRVLDEAPWLVGAPVALLAFERVRRRAPGSA